MASGDGIRLRAFRQLRTSRSLHGDCVETQAVRAPATYLPGMKHRCITKFDAAFLALMMFLMGGACAVTTGHAFCSQVSCNPD